MRMAGADAYPFSVEACDARPRNVGTALMGVVLVWSVVALMLPRTDADRIAPDPIGARIEPMTALTAIASDRPTTTLDVRRAEHPDAIPAIVSATAGTRSALVRPNGDVRSPMTSIARARFAAQVTRRGPPFSSLG